MVKVVINMEQRLDWNLSVEEKAEYIRRLTNELVTLRAKAGIPQDELSRIVGISRQTYGAIERKDKDMSWGTYLGLLFFFDQNKQTHQLLRQTGVFPDELILHFNNGESSGDAISEDGINFPVKEMLDSLDDQGIHAVKTLLMVEYARCKGLPGDVVIKSFDGQSFSDDITSNQKEVSAAVKKIKEKRKSGG